MQTLALTLAFAFAASVHVSGQTAPASAPAGAKPVPAVVLSYWEKLVGTWVADNGKFKNETDTMDAYGIEWRWGLGKRSLVGRLYGIKASKDVGTFWEFREFWHPGEARLIATQHASAGTYGAGPHEVRADGTSEMVQTFFDPEAGTKTTVGHRSRLEGNVHTTSSFNVDEKGVWTMRRTYVWRRQ